MRARLTHPGIFLVFLLLAAIIQWPAAALAPWLESASGGQWRLAAASGTVWHGAGMLLARTPGSATWRNVQSLGWQMRAGALLRGRLVIDLAPEQGALRLIATPGGIAAESLDATLPATAIASLLPGALGRYGWSGMLHAHGSAFACDWRGNDCRGEIELLWNDAAVTEIPGPALGDYRVRLQGDGAVLRVGIETLRGRLQIGANGEIAGGGRIQLRGEAAAMAADGESNASLNALLGTLGRPTSGGKYLLDYREAGAAPR